MTIKIQSSSVIKEAYDRISSYVHKTPILYSDTLNQMLNNNVYFKIDAMQKTGAFKVRGVLNHLLHLKEQGDLPKKVVAYSTGNHALALAYVAKLLSIKSRVYLPQNVSPFKKRIAKHYGAEVMEVDTRAEAEDKSLADSKSGFYYVHPSDNDYTISGAGTMAYEALNELSVDSKPTAIFAPCGGGGLLSGTYLAKELVDQEIKVIGCEPDFADDAARSLKANKLLRFDASPETIADGLRALSLTERTFEYIKKLDDLMVVDEKEIYYWTAWLFQLIKVTCEPSSAISMAAAYNYIEKNKIKGENLLILISGGNIDPSFYKDLWCEEKYINTPIG